MADDAKLGEFLREHRKTLEVLAFILLLIVIGFSGPVHVGDIVQQINNTHGDVNINDVKPSNGFNLFKVIEDIWHAFTQNGNLLGS